MANPLQSTTTQPKVIQLNNNRSGRGGYQFSGSGKGSTDMRDQVRNQEKAADVAQDHKRKAQLFAALTKKRALAIEGGAMKYGLPEINEHMSLEHMREAARSINRTLGLPADDGFNLAADGGTSAKGPLNPSGTAPGSQVPHPELQSRTKDTGRNSGQQQGPVAPQAVPMTAPAGPLGALQNIAAMAMQRAANAPDASSPVPSDTPQAPASSTGNPLRDKLIHDGTIRPDAKFEQSPAGMSVEMQSASGPRQVQFQPTGEQALEAKFGNVAMQQYGKPFSQLEPGQRATILRANPVSRVRGEVLANGQGAFNRRGERFMDTTGGVIREVDPSQDKMLNPLAKGNPLLPQGAEGGYLVPEKYGGGVASVSRGAFIPNSELQDPASGQVPQMRATPPAAAPIPGQQAPAAPAVPQAPVPQDKTKIPGDPASLAQSPADFKRNDYAEQKIGNNPLSFANRMAGDATPLGLQAAQGPRVAQTPTPLTTPAPETPDPVAQAWEAGPQVAGAKNDSNAIEYPDTGGMAFQHNTAPKPQQRLRTTGVLDALGKGNLSEMAAHINNADVAATQGIARFFTDHSKGTAFEGSALGRVAAQTAQQPAPAGGPVATVKLQPKDQQPAPVADEEKNKKKNPLANL